MNTLTFDDKVRNLIFNDKLNPQIIGYIPNEGHFDLWGSRLLSINAYKCYTLLNGIEKVVGAETAVGWLMKQMNIESDICASKVITNHLEMIENIQDIIESDKDEESGLYWLFDTQEQADEFDRLIQNIIKPTDILLICNQMGFDINHTADIFSAALFDHPTFYVRFDKDNNDDEHESRYFRPLFTAIVYFWALENNLISSFDFILNNNKDNYAKD